MTAASISIRDRVENIRARIRDAAQKSGRREEDITLVAVTKGVSPNLVREAIEAGVNLFGESKVQEASSKIPEIPAVWHLVGHLQTNKVRAAVELFQMIQSVDSVRLAKKISEESLALSKETEILLEVNISGEGQKYGFSTEALYTAFDEIAELPGLRIRGLMGIAPFGAGEEAVRGAFRTLKGIFSVCKGIKRGSAEMKFLSMGMSNDFETAIEEGANMVRIGRALFK